VKRGRSGSRRIPPPRDASSHSSMPGLYRGEWHSDDDESLSRSPIRCNNTGTAASHEVESGGNETSAVGGEEAVVAGDGAVVEEAFPPPPVLPPFQRRTARVRQILSCQI